MNTPRLIGLVTMNTAPITVIASASVTPVRPAVADIPGPRCKKELCMTPNLGSIGLVEMKGAVGKGIRVAQWLNGDGFADYQHAFVYVGDEEIIEAMPGGALLSRLDKYDPDSIAWLQCPPEFGAQVAAAARALEGIPYSFLDYSAIAAHRFHLPIPHLQAYIASTGHMICSQLADHAAKQGGWHLFEDERWEGFVTPLDIYELIP
jgi:hypothetical protein